MHTEESVIIKNLYSIHQRIQRACIATNRNPSEVKLLLVTKTIPAEQIKIALGAGQFRIGENKVQELKKKIEVLKNIPHEKHFIGHLQTNKIKEVLQCDISCIQSVDSWELAEKLNSRLQTIQKHLPVFIQVNTSDEKSKFGVSTEELMPLVKKISTLSYVRIKGLMTIGALSEDEQVVRACFRKLKILQQQISLCKIPNVEMKELSMGMSGDLEIAIQEGSTMVRIGSAIFGERMYN